MSSYLLCSLPSTPRLASPQIRKHHLLAIADLLQRMLPLVSREEIGRARVVVLGTGWPSAREKKLVISFPSWARRSFSSWTPVVQVSSSSSAAASFFPPAPSPSSPPPPPPRRLAALEIVGNVVVDVVDRPVIRSVVVVVHRRRHPGRALGLGAAVVFISLLSLFSRE